MQIIMMHSRLKQAKSLTLSTKHIIAFFLIFFFFTSLIAVSIVAFGASRAAQGSSFWNRILPNAVVASSGANADKYIKDNLSAMAVKVGEIQAHIIRLDALGERVQTLAGVKPEEFNFKEMPGVGGPEVLAFNSTEASLKAFDEQLNALHKQVGLRSDFLNVVESNLMDFKLQSKLLPTMLPVSVGYNASSFGRRTDPITGRSAFHEGVDFSAPTGTPIVAAAGGVVIAAEYHSDFGNMIEVDHGGDMITRYGHCSKLIAKVGDIVKRGQLIAHIGSTGRSTGAHLHFEVRIRNMAQDPQKFFSAGAEKGVPIRGTR